MVKGPGAPHAPPYDAELARGGSGFGGAALGGLLAVLRAGHRHPVITLVLDYISGRDARLERRAGKFS